MSDSVIGSWSAAKALALTVLALTVVQLAIAAFVPGLEQFEGKGFAARLFAYPLMMLVVPVAFTAWARTQARPPPQPWGAYALIWLPFLIDVSGNTLDLYDSVSWWDDANHFVNWFLLSAGIGLILTSSSVTRAWALLWLTAGIGALLAIVWEVGEYFAFIRHGTELETAYRDTLGDEVLGSLGALLAGLVVAARVRRIRPGA